MSTYELIKNRLDWKREDGYCKQYIVRYWSAEWSRGTYWTVEGITQSDSSVDLGMFETYRSDYRWLGECLGTHSA